MGCEISSICEKEKEDILSHFSGKKNQISKFKKEKEKSLFFITFGPQFKFQSIKKTTSLTI